MNQHLHQAHQVDCLWCLEGFFCEIFNRLSVCALVDGLRDPVHVLCLGVVHVEKDRRLERLDVTSGQCKPCQVDRSNLRANGCLAQILHLIELRDVASSG